MNDELLGASGHWTELAVLHHQRMHLLLDHYEERIKRPELEAGLRSIEQKASSLAKRSMRMPCLLRGTVGADHTSYHSADAPCGRVTGKGRDIKSFMRLPEDQVFYSVPKYEYNFGLDRCSSCQWNRAAMIYGRRLLDARLLTK